MLLRWEALGEAELVVEENVLVLELTVINLSCTEEDREEADLSIHFQTSEEPIRVPDVMLGSRPHVLVH